MAKRKPDSPEIDRVCAYCEHAKLLYHSDEVLCEKKGVVAGGYCCHRFLYDPLKRIPKRKTAPDLSLPPLENADE